MMVGKEPSVKKIILSALVTVCVTAFNFFTFPDVAAALPAFPGAEGFGSDTAGGRGGRVIEVTNLNESGAGSLRAALEASGPRIVVFRTGGTITLTSNLKISNPYITVAGQTAPGDGIQIRGAAITVITHDVVIRGLRIRTGDGPGPSPDNRDAMQVEAQNGEVYNVVIDHCSFSWGIDENVAFYYKDTHDVTLSNSIISEALYNSLHSKGPHGMGFTSGQADGSTYGPKNIAIIGNLFVSNDQRNPRLSLSSAFVANNVVYNRGLKDVDIGSGVEAQHVTVVGNLFLKGNSYKGNNKSIFIRNDAPAGSRIFANDNDCSSYNSGVCYEYHTSFNPITDSPPVWPLGYVAKPSSAILDSVLTNAGARPFNPGPVDTRIINNVRNGTGNIIDSQSQVGGWPTLRPGSAAQDTDRDGMPDNWEVNHGLNSNDPNDQNSDRNSDGYTNIEEYINSFFTLQSIPMIGSPSNLRVTKIAPGTPGG